VLTKRPLLTYGLIAGLFLLIVVACSLSSRLPPRTDLAPAATPPENEARVSQVEIRKQTPLPINISAVIRGELLDQCVEVDRIEQQRLNTVFDLKVITRRLDGVECTGQPQPFEETVALQVDGLTAGSYTVMAEGVTTAGNLFNLLVDNVEPPPPPADGLIEGLIWRDECRSPAAPSARTNCTAPEAKVPDGYPDEDELRLEGVIVTLARGDCPAGDANTATDADINASLTTGEDGRYRFAALVPGAYCLIVDSQTPENAALLRGGDWIAPAAGVNRVPLNLAAGETITLDFGWHRRANSLSARGELCRDRAVYVADITIPDNTRLAPTEAFTKIWRIRNEGNCAWSQPYGLVFGDQEPMRADPTRPLTRLVRPGEEIDLSIDLIAPERAGTYRSIWALQGEENQVFGSFYVQVVVEESDP
jgi:hypothetical protein